MLANKWFDYRKLWISFHKYHLNLRFRNNRAAWQFKYSVIWLMLVSVVNYFRRKIAKCFLQNAKVLFLHYIDLHKLYPHSWVTKSSSRMNKLLFPFHLLKFPDMISTFSETQRKEFPLNSLCVCRSFETTQNLLRI